MSSLARSGTPPIIGPAFEPNVDRALAPVAVYDVGTFDDRIFVAKEYVPGQTLARQNATPRSQRDIIEAYRAIGRELAAAHAACIVDRDCEPENIYAALPGPGAAPVPTSAAGPTLPAMLTAPGPLLGTPYMAPELYGGPEADACSDPFNFCVALSTTRYGKRPFDGDTFVSLATNVCAGRLRDPQISPPGWRRIRAVIRRLAVDPAARFASLGELLFELAPTSYRQACWAVGLIIGLLLVVGLLLVA